MSKRQEERRRMASALDEPVPEEESDRLESQDGTETQPPLRDETANSLLSAIRERADYALLYQPTYLAVWAGLPADEFVLLKLQLKDIFGTRFKVRDFEKAVNAARDRSDAGELGVALRHGEVDGRPNILITLPPQTFIRHSYEALKKWNTATPTIFSWAGATVRIKADQHTGLLQTEALDADIMKLCMIDSARYFRPNKNVGSVEVVPPTELAKMMLTLKKTPTLPLRNIITTPVVLSDGRPIVSTGYDRSSATLANIDGSLAGLRDTVPLSPSPTELQAALDDLLALLEDFPFESPADLASILGMILTPFVTAGWSCKAPLFILTAPQAGTGKSLLANIATLIYSGRPANVIQEPARISDDWTKTLHALLLAGEKILLFDNVERRFNNSNIASLLTAERLEGRILGSSQRFSVPNTITWIATGNNLQIGGDIARRAVVVGLNAKMSQPWRRKTFKIPNILPYVVKNRPRLLRAVLILILNWFKSGAEIFTDERVGNFETWSEVVGGILNAAGVSGFLQEISRAYERNDTEAVIWEAFLWTLHSIYGDKEFTARDVYRRMSSEGPTAESLRENCPDDVYSSFGNDIKFTRQLGIALGRKSDTRYGSSAIRVIQSRQLHGTWHFTIEGEGLSSVQPAASAQIEADWQDDEDGAPF